MKGFTPTTKSHGFSPDFLWSGLRSGLPAIALAQARRAGCRATNSRRSQNESTKLSGAMGLPAVFFTRRLCGGLAGWWVCP